MATGKEVTQINRKLREKAEKEKSSGAETKEPEPVLVDGELPGFETEKIPELIRAGKSYNQAKKARMKMLETEVERKALVMSLMHEHKLNRYKYGKLTIDLESTEKLKVSEDDDK